MQRTRFIGLRVSEAERDALLELAQRERRGKSEALRELIRDAARKAGCWPPAPAREGVQDARSP